MARLLSVNVGLPKDVSWQDRTVFTSVWKAPVAGPRMVRRLNIEGDGQGDLAGHGGEHRAVLVYQTSAYQYWQRELNRPALAYGQFGENFTVDGLPDTDVCIGDRYRIGGALFEVTQPRVTCYRLGLRMDEPEMAALLVRHGKPGFYLRVLEEGEVAAGDEIRLIAPGPERMSVAEIDALLYRPGHPRAQLERALRIPALSAGWRGSFEALLAQADDAAATGNAGLGQASAAPPAWPGLREFRVAQKVDEGGAVVSLMLAATDGLPLPPALPGQYIVIRLGSTPALMRTYSLSGPPGAPLYRISVKEEVHGAASGFIAHALRPGDRVEASAARGTFTLRAGSTPVILLSAGIGVTPVLAMLHALTAEASPRDIWWVYGARSGRAHPFAAEARALLEALPHHHRHIRYSAPAPDDRPGADYDAAGHVDLAALRALALPRDGDFYLCGPAGFMHAMTAALAELDVPPGRIHTELFGDAPAMTPGIAAAPRIPPHLPDAAPTTGPMVSFARSGLDARWDPKYQSLLELAEACDVPVRWSCRTGVCHSCETGMVAGKIGYDPTPIDAPADGIVLLCCARPDGDIVLDL